MKIVAPGGSPESFEAAIKAGANEIYMSIKGLGARRNATNFTIDEFKKAIDYAHLRNVKILMTLNTIMHDYEFEFYYNNIKELYEYGLDTAIVQDMGFARFLMDNFPHLNIHASTQMTIANHYEVEYLKNIGFSRVVLPRELLFDEIKKIKENTNTEIEVFVSGALCICYSGNCYMSSFIGGRSGNRGLCAQPCRKKYKLNNEYGFYLSPKDQLMSYTEIKKLIDIDIDAIKIEGRMKDPRYVFSTVQYYKNLIDNINSYENTSYIFNRGYSKGYFYGNSSDLINKNYSSNLGRNIGKLYKKEVILTENISLGDGIIFLDKEYNKLGGKFINKIYKKSGDFGIETKVAKYGDTIIFSKIPKNTKYIYKNYDKKLNDLLENNIKQSKIHIPIDINITAKIGNLLKINLIYIINMQKIEVVATGDVIIEHSQKINTDKEDIIKKLTELGNTTFTPNNINSYIDQNIFIPISDIKNLKRKAISLLEEKIINSYKRKTKSKIILNIENLKRIEKPIFSAIVTTKEQFDTCKKFGIKKIYIKSIDVAKENNLQSIDLTSKLASNLYQLIENKNHNVTLNWNFNIINSYAFEEYSKNPKVDTIIISPEINFENIKKIKSKKVKKAIIIYGHIQCMYTELNLFNKNLVKFTNEENDTFIAVKNKNQNTEIYMKKTLNIISELENLKNLDIDEYVLSFSIENKEKTLEILQQLKNKKSVNTEKLNYIKGVF